MTYDVEIACGPALTQRTDDAVAAWHSELCPAFAQCVLVTQMLMREKEDGHRASCSVLCSAVFLGNVLALDLMKPSGRLQFGEEASTGLRWDGPRPARRLSIDVRRSGIMPWGLVLCTGVTGFPIILQMKI